MSRLNNKSLNIYVTQELYETLKKAGAKKGMNVSAIMRVACYEYLENHNLTEISTTDVLAADNK